MKHTLRLCALVFVALVVVFSVFVWNVSRTPIDVSFAKPYLEAALHDKATGNYAKMGQAVLYWPNLKGPLYLQLQDGQLFDKGGVPIISVEQVDISFSRRGILRGRIMPKQIIMKEPTLRLTRHEDGAIKLDIGEAENKDKAQDEQLKLTTRIFGYIARPGEESAHDSLIARLQAFAIEDALVLVEDRVAKQTWSLPDFDLDMTSTEEGMHSEMSIQLPQSGFDKSFIDVKMNYIWGQKNVELSADVHSINAKDIISKIPELNVPGTQNVIVDAHVETILDENFVPSDVRLAITSEEGDVIHPALSDDPVPYKNLQLNATYNYAGKALQVKDTQLTLNGITVNAKAEISHTENEITGPVEIWIDETEHSKIKPVWPKALEGENAEHWIVDSMADGVLKDVHVSLDVLAKHRKDELTGDMHWDLETKNILALFKAEGMTLDYRAPLDKAYDIYGSGRFDFEADTLDIKIDKGRLGKMPVRDASLFFDYIIAEGKGDANINVNLSGNIADVMRYISNDPINLGDRIGMDVNKVKGTADLNIGLVFPAQDSVKIEDFKITAKGKLKNVLFPKVIEGLDLGGGPLDFAVDDGKVMMSGNAMIDNRPMKFSWETFLESAGKPYVEKITAKVTADPNIRQKLGVDLSEFIEGPLPIEVGYMSFKDGTAKADVKVDATPALFFVSPFDFEKQPGEKAGAHFMAHFKGGKIQKITNLTAEGADFTLDESTITFIQNKGETWLKSGMFPAFTLLETEGEIAFKFDDERAVDINMDASFLDARPFMNAEEAVAEYEEPRMRITTTAKQMRTAPNETIQNVRTFVDIDEKGRFNQIEMDGRAGSSNVFMRFNEMQDGKRTFRMKTDDAGALLKAFQVHNDIKGGTMVIYGEPIHGIQDRNIRGKAEITNFRVEKAPALTKILSILSLTGIGDALSNDGLGFSKMEADFSWLYRSKGSLLVMKNGRTSGNSLGLLFEGTFDNEKRFVDVSGTVVPMDGLNKVIGSIPIVGDILTGGSGGVFAATYSVKGPSDNPEISANPLSVLTPGILRRILWE